MMVRILFWIALGLLVYFAVRSKLRAGQVRHDAQRRQDKLGETEPMVSCAHCGMFVPASEAVHAEGLDYCSPAHVRLPPK